MIVGILLHLDRLLNDPVTVIFLQLTNDEVVVMCNEQTAKEVQKSVPMKVQVQNADQQQQQQQSQQFMAAAAAVASSSTSNEQLIQQELQKLHKEKERLLREQEQNNRRVSADIFS